MAWIIASIPLWIIGGFCLILAVYGFFRFVQTNDYSDMNAAAVLCIIAAIVLPLAAKVAS